MTPVCDLESAVPVPWRLTAKTEAMTADIAASLAQVLGPGDVVLLQGEKKQDYNPQISIILLQLAVREL